MTDMLDLMVPRSRGFWECVPSTRQQPMPSPTAPPVECIVGLATDGASVMTGFNRGVDMHTIISMVHCLQESVNHWTLGC